MSRSTTEPNPAKGGPVAAAPSNGAIVSCAITGSIHTPSFSPHLPLTPDDIAEEAIAAARAGAAIVHLHARDRKDGRPTADTDVWRAIVERIRAESDVILNLTTGGGVGMTLAERMRPVAEFQPELCSLNMGSTNFGLFPMAERKDGFRFDWEESYLRSTHDFVYRNTFADIEHVIRAGDEAGTRFEYECYDLGQLNTVAHYADAGLLRPPFFIQLVFGILGGAPVDVATLIHYKERCDRLFGDDYFWTAIAGGRHQMRFATMSAICGGNVRVGLEDSVYLERGRLATSNQEQVAKISRILNELSIPVATAADARSMLDLRGAKERSPIASNAHA